MAITKPRVVTDDYAVLDQIGPEDVVHLKKLGFKSIINHRPDGEEEGQATAEAIGIAASRSDMAYLFLPVEGEITPVQRDMMRAALANMPKPIVAFCRSGSRSTRIWAHSMRGHMTDRRIVAIASQAGCDSVSLTAELESYV